MKIHNIWVNSSGTMERSYNDIPRDTPLQTAMANVALQHPSWTSMVITVVNPNPIHKDQQAEPGRAQHSSDRNGELPFPVCGLGPH